MDFTRSVLLDLYICVSMDTTTGRDSQTVAHVSQQISSMCVDWSNALHWSNGKVHRCNLYTVYCRFLYPLPYHLLYTAAT